MNNTMVGATGALVTYILSATGRDKAMVKGAGIGAMQWIVIYGLMSRLGLATKSTKSLTHILSFADHAVFGAMMGLFASKLGDDSLFPDKKVIKGKKLPIIATDEPSNNNRTDEVNHSNSISQRISRSICKETLEKSYTPSYS